MSVIAPRRQAAVDPEEMVTNGVLRSTEQMLAAGVSKSSLWRAVRSGRVEQVIRGVFCAPDTLAETGIRYAALALANPGSVICLLSAARMHEITDEAPLRVWIAVRRSATRNPARDGPGSEARTVWWRDAYFHSGVEIRPILGVDVHVTDLPRTVVDLIRFRTKFGDEPAMKALHDYVRLDGSLSDLWRQAKEVDGLDAVEPFIRAADEFRESVIVGRM